AIAVGMRGRQLGIPSGERRHRFSPPPPRGAVLLGWATDVPNGSVSSVSQAVPYDGAGTGVVLALEPVWPVRISLNGLDAASGAEPSVGLRFPSPERGSRWARTVQLVEDRPAGYHLVTQVRAGVFELPMLPEQAELQVSATCGTL